MELDFSKITINDFLFKIGKGNHVPGSGSAAAFQGMISAKLLITVISKSNEEKYRKRYSNVLPQLLDMKENIEKEILPKLERFFHEDSFYFNKAIEARKERDSVKEIDFYLESEAKKKSVEELKTSCEIPLDIADLCVTLANYAQFVFDNAFRTARGDSQVALGGAVASVAGCLSIVQLNFLSFKINHYDWVTGMMNRYRVIKKQYVDLTIEVDNRVNVLESEVSTMMSLFTDIDAFMKKSKSGKIKSDTEIENIVIEFQYILWKHKQKIWGNNVKSPLQILDTITVFKKVLNYDIGQTRVLSKQSDGLECAGEIDQPKRQVLISSQFKPEIKNFTFAHELGHAVLHNFPILHRDIPIDSEVKGPRKPIEWQADKFATYFLMPKKQVQKVFQEIFSSPTFVVDEASAFYLVNGNISDLRKKYKSISELAKALASAEFYAGKPVLSLAKQFNVSVGAMAIRLEEMKLIIY